MPLDFSESWIIWNILRLLRKVKQNNLMLINWQMNLIKPGGKIIRTVSSDEDHC